MKDEQSVETMYDELRQIVEKEEKAYLLEALKTKARNVKISRREQFEEALLKLAQKIKTPKVRTVLYETMVSLQPIWEKFKPQQGLQAEFQKAIVSEQYEGASQIYRNLVAQELDYLGSFSLGEGRFISLEFSKILRLLRYNQNELTFYSQKLNELERFNIPEGESIIDIIAPPPGNLPNTGDWAQKLWLLCETCNGEVIYCIVIKKNPLAEELEIDLKHCMYRLKGEEKKSNRLSYYCDTLLLISDESIMYLSEDKGWTTWYSPKATITAFETTKKGLWVGQSDGDVFLLKQMGREGVRDAIYKEKPDRIEKIIRQGNFVLTCGPKWLKLSDHAGTPQLSPLNTQSDIVSCSVLNNGIALIHLANGMLEGFELKQGNKCLQINIQSVYEIILPAGNYLYCINREGEALLFQQPDLSLLSRNLKDHNVVLSQHSNEFNPVAPIRHLSGFIGRKQLLDEVKEDVRAHFLFFGEARIGKSSILSALRETVSDKAKCCFVDLEQLLTACGSYQEFESKFMKRCLIQNYVEINDLKEKEGYQGLREMINHIKAKRSYVVFLLDSFFIPGHFDKDGSEKFHRFVRSLLIHPSARILASCRLPQKSLVMRFINECKDILSQRKMRVRPLSFLSEDEVKDAIRRRVSMDRGVVDTIFSFTGGFPHLLRFYENPGINLNSVEEQSTNIARTFSYRIFEYFRDLSPSATLLVATCLKDNLLGESIGYNAFYKSYPFLETSLPRRQLLEAINELTDYSRAICAESDREAFRITLEGNPRLFYEASKHIKWLDQFSTFFRFTSNPDYKKGQEVVETFAAITGATLDMDESFFKGTSNFNQMFYVVKLTEDGRRHLDMPLTTYIVIPLKPWERANYLKTFNSLYLLLQDFKRKSADSEQMTAIQKFYVILLELHGISPQEIKDDLVGLERISILDASQVKDIILDKSPGKKASEYIFSQLSIKERSPYTTSGAVPDELFFGREMELQLIRGLPENIGIFGTRTIGKTSLLRKLHKTIRMQPKWRVYAMDCSRIDSEETLLKNLAEKMGAPYGEISDMEAFRRYVTQSAEEGEFQYLFLLDEVDRLVEYDIKNEEKIFNTFNRLGTETMANDQSPARFILFGFHEMFAQMKNPSSRLYNFMVFLPLKPLDVESALALVTRPIENIRVQWKDRNDALHLVDSCSGHPRLLQAACHSLLAVLDGKKDRKDIIEKQDVEEALTSAEFREICMRFYYNPEQEKYANGKEARTEKKTSFFSRMLSHEEAPIKEDDPKRGKVFWNDLHRLTILSTIRLQIEEKKKNFSITEIHDELSRLGVKISPNAMRMVLDHLCLSGNLNLRNEATVISKRQEKLRDMIKKGELKKDGLSVDVPRDEAPGAGMVLPKFVFEFGVKIFPKLLVANFGGIKMCKEEIQTLVEQGDWKEWAGRY